jgi:magnesium-transporting ATPase (P-type)
VRIRRVEAFMRWYQKEIDEVVKNLDSSSKGLSSEEAEKRLQEYGLNQLGAALLERRQC